MSDSDYDAAGGFLEMLAARANAYETMIDADVRSRTLRLDWY